MRTALGGTPKRALDFCVAGIALVLLSPMLLITGLLIRLLLGKPVLLAERRIGFEGKLFTCYTFRIGLADKAKFNGRKNTSTPAGHVRGLDPQSWADSLGICFRASALDKLPQLVNVLRGDMSLVGPQLITPENLPDRCAQAPEVLLARPGMIGMWNQTLRSLCSHATNMALDRYYVHHWSMWLDFKILGTALVRGLAQDSANPTK